MPHSQEIIDKVEQIKKQTGCIKVWVGEYTNPDLWIRIYNENQLKFLKEDLASYSIISSLLNPIFETKQDDIDIMWRMYNNALDSLD